MDYAEARYVAACFGTAKLILYDDVRKLKVQLGMSCRQGVVICPDNELATSREEKLWLQHSNENLESTMKGIKVFILSWHLYFQLSEALILA